MDQSLRLKISELMAYGLYLVGARGRNGPTIIIANWVSQVSFHPPLLMVSIESGSQILQDIEYAKHFSVNMLAAGEREIAKAFMKPVSNKEGVLSASSGSPVLEDAVAWFDTKVSQSFVAGDHTIFIGEVIDGKLNREGSILTLKETGWKYSR